MQQRPTHASLTVSFKSSALAVCDFVLTFSWKPLRSKGWFREAEADANCGQFVDVLREIIVTLR